MNFDFFGYLKPWSRRKHRLLGKYLPPFSAKVAKTTNNREIFCIDGFAGAARYEDGSEGSPLLIAKFADECANWKNPVALKLINVEPDAKNEGIFESLQRATSEWTKKDIVTNINKDFRSALPEILQIIDHSPALFFLDPFGPTYIHFDDLRPILARNQRITELIINFDQDGLRRIADAAFSEKINPKTAVTNAQNISRVIGNDEWKSKINLPGQNSLESEKILLREYMTNISRFGYKVVAYPIRESLGAKPKYYFVYCTRHAHGIALMNDFIREEEDSLYGDHVASRLPLFSEEASLSNDVEKRQSRLRKVVQDYLQKNSLVTRGKIKVDFISQYFGEFHSKDYNTVVQLLLKNGVLREETGKMRINDDHILYVVSGK